MSIDNYSYKNLFLDNKYTKWYFQIIDKAKSENRVKSKRNDSNYVYYENHHIIPRCMKGDNSERNLVLLTAREHFICHWLLCKMILDDILFKKLKFSLVTFQMCPVRGDRKLSSKLYSIAKERHNFEYCRLSYDEKFGIERSQEIKKLKSFQRTGMKVSKEIVNKIVESRCGYRHSQETKEKISIKAKERFADYTWYKEKFLTGYKKRNFKHSIETKRIMSENNKGINNPRHKNIEIKIPIKEINNIKSKYTYIIQNIQFNSMRECMENIPLTRRAIIERCNSINYPDWVMIINSGKESIPYLEIEKDDDYGFVNRDFTFLDGKIYNPITGEDK